MNRPRPTVILPALRKQEWFILELRYGWHKKATFEEGAEQIGVTRQRVQQIDARALRQVRKFFRDGPSELDVLEGSLSGRRSRASSIGKDGSAVVGIAVRATRANRRPLERLGICVRALVAHGGLDLVAPWPNLVTLFCSATPAISRHPTVAAGISAARAATRSWSYSELAQTVLERVGHPTHWTTLAEAAENLGHRPNFARAGFYNALIARPDVFVRTDLGTYGLASSGLKSARQYVDIIADVLERAGTSMGFGETAARVDEERPIKPGSLQMFLSLHPRFYTSIQGTYGLRTWLPPRHKQTLLTAPYLIEASDSFERVARAASRGYDMARFGNLDDAPLPD